MGALHDASGQYYSTGLGGAGNMALGGPSDKMGWAIGAGIKVLTPMIGAGDYFQAQVNYSQGALGYLNNSGGTYSKFNNGAGTVGFGVTSDSTYGNGGSIELTTGWNVNAAYEHFWSKSYQTSVYGGYQKITYDSTANTGLCTGESTIFGAAFTLAAGCNNNWGLWNVGSRTQWNIDSQTALGVDVVYQRLQTSSGGLVATTTVANGAIPAGTVRTLADQGSWMGQFRIHRNFYP
jgi:hypothetical protein